MLCKKGKDNRIMVPPRDYLTERKENGERNSRDKEVKAPRNRNSIIYKYSSDSLEPENYYYEDMKNSQKREIK